MITREQAETIAAAVLGTPPGDADAGWELVEFDAGWLIREAWLDDEEALGGAVRVVERASGRVIQFPSSVPTRRILTQYERVAHAGWVEDSGISPDEVDGPGK